MEQLLLYGKKTYYLFVNGENKTILNYILPPT